MTYVFNLTRT